MEGGTRLRFSYVMGPGPSGTTMAITSNPGKETRVLRRRINEVHANMQQTDPPLTDVLGLLSTLSEAWAGVRMSETKPLAQPQTAWSQLPSEEAMGGGSHAWSL